MAKYLPELMKASTGGGDQIQITVADATAIDALSMFNSTVLQIGVIVAIGAVVTGMQWDTRSGSSVFYRVRARHVAAVTIPRLIVAMVVSIATYGLGFVIMAVTTAAFIGPLDASIAFNTAVASSMYLLMSMAIAYLLMAKLRRFAAALGAGAGIALTLPLIAPINVLESWSPTTLLSAQTKSLGELALPIVVAGIVGAFCVVLGTRISQQQSLRRDA